MRVILHRYHEEQVWSDKIRSASTYGSLTVLGLNLVVFILAIIVVEPWKRRRLAQTFEKKVEEMSAETISAFETRHQDLARQIKEQDEALSQLVEVVTNSLQPAVPLPAEGFSSSHSTSASNLNLDEHTSNQQLWVVVASATTAGVLGCIVGAWFGS
jgi:sensitive to high expression protein 9, mitochondrial